MNIDEAKIRHAEVTSDSVILTEATGARECDEAIIWCNAALLAETGYKRDEVIGASPKLFYGPETCLVTVARMSEALASLRPTRERLLNYRKDGTAFWVDLSISLAQREGTGPGYRVTVQRNIDAQVRLERDLAAAQDEAHQARERLWEAINALPDGFVLYDAEDRAVIFNRQYQEIYKESAAALRPGATFEEILREGLANGQYLEAIGQEERWLRERLAFHRHPEGPVEQSLPGDRFLQVREVLLKNGDTVGFRTDITTLKRQQRELEAKAKALDTAARTDPLTGLLNRRGLDLQMADAIDGHSDTECFAILHVDLDRFKPINDVFGHAAGDHLLRIIADLLRSSTREQDIVARVGGDEFVVFQAGRPSKDDASGVAERILAGCNVPADWMGKPLHFGCSIGIALGTGSELGTLLQNADIALYEAKRAGRGRCHMFSQALRDAMQEKKRLSDEMLEGLKRGEFVAYFQPQMKADDFSLVGAEALVRWNNPRCGLLPPSAFLSIAEELGLLSEIDECVMEQAFSMAWALYAAGHALSGVSVNVSLARLLALGNLDGLRKYRKSPFKVSFELLEAIDFDEELPELGWTIDGLRDLGFGIELDDFGSGRSSLTSLLSLRPDRIKIERKIVSAALDDTSGARSMVRAIAEMCRGLGIPMTAEGVETKEHAHLMHKLGCDRLQGFHFSEPLTCEGLLEFAADWRTGPLERSG